MAIEYHFETSPELTAPAMLDYFAGCSLALSALKNLAHPPEQVGRKSS